MKNAYARLVRVLSDPRLRPVEVWAFRAVAAYLAVKLGVTVEQAAS